MNQASQHVQVIARLKVQPQQVEPMVELMSQLCQSGQNAPGNLRFEVLQCASDPTMFVTHETWADTTAADTHMGSDYVESTLRQLSTMLAGEPDITRYRQIA